MISVIRGNSNTEILVNSINTMDKAGELQKSRTSVNSSAVVSIGHAVVELSNPINRWMAHPERKDNILGIMGEVLWVLSGGYAIDNWMSIMVPRAKMFSDDMVTWRGAYGERLYNYDQLQTVTDRLRSDLGNRKCVATIHDPSRDSDVGLVNSIGSINTADMICNIALSFKYRNGGLDCTVFNRSNDLIWGLTNVNLVEFTIIQEIIATMLKVDMGNYVVMTDDLHWYPEVSNIKKQVSNIRAYVDDINEAPVTTIDLGSLNSWYKIRTYFQHYIATLEDAASRYNSDHSILEYVMEDVGREFQPGSTLDVMMWLAGAHYLCKTTGAHMSIQCEHLVNSPFVKWVANRLGDKSPFILE